MDECADVAIEMLEATGVRTPVVMLGTSWGGIVAPRVALKAPARLKGMVLFNTTAEPASFSSKASSRLLTMLLSISALDRLVDKMLLSLQLGAGTRRHEPEIGANLAARFRSWNRRSVISTVRSVLVDRDGMLGALPGVNASALIVSGAEDTILPAAFSRRIAETMPHARHVEVPGAAHLVPLEQPGVANTLILEFIATMGYGA